MYYICVCMCVCVCVLCVCFLICLNLEIDLLCLEELSESKSFLNSCLLAS